MSKIVAKAKNNKFIAVVRDNKIVSKSRNLCRQGEQGPPGLDFGEFTSTAGEDLIAYQAVYVQNDLAFIASNDDSLHFLSFAGVTTVGATTSNPVDIRTDGHIVNPGWNWSPNLEIFLGTGGGLTQTPPVPASTRYRIVVGEATGPQSMIVRIGEPILFDL